ncbi:hypothetical protein GCM10027048_29850 [Hymenobacter coalescens]
MKPVLLLGLLLGATAPLTAQTRPAASAAVATTAEARVGQYYADLNQRLRDIYFAPSDGRAITLLSTATEEFEARRRALRQELAQLRPTLPPARWQALTAGHPSPEWTNEQQVILNSPAAAKLAERCRRDPALETALQRFTAARLEQLLPAAAQ